jgi:hypothetical protein
MLVAVPCGWVDRERSEVVAPLALTCAGVSMFEKADGEWKLVGNVSNFKPEEE